MRLWLPKREPVSLLSVGRMFVLLSFGYVLITAYLYLTFVAGIKASVDDIQKHQLPNVLSQNRNAMKIEKLASLTRSAALAPDARMARRIQLQTRVLAQSFTLDNDPNLSNGAARIAAGVKKIVELRALSLPGQPAVAGAMQRTITDAEIRKVYDETIATTQEMSDGLMRNAALIVDNISTDIRRNTAGTERAWIAILLIPAIVALLLFLAYQTHIVDPINMAIQRLMAVGTPEFAAGTSREPLIHDLRLIRRAVETYGEVSDELRRTNELLLVLSDEDPLTKLGNRRKFDEALADALAQSRREGGPVSLLLVDLDHFKRINDTHGHQGGDACLTVVAEILKRACRSVSHIATRYGGEEFGIVLAGTSEADARILAETIRAEIQTTSVKNLESGDIRMTASIGIAAVAPGGLSTAATLIALADQALYQAKHRGRNLVVVLGDEQRGSRYAG